MFHVERTIVKALLKYWITPPNILENPYTPNPIQTILHPYNLRERAKAKSVKKLLRWKL